MKKVLIFIFLSILIFSEPYDNFENLYTGINYLLEKRDDKTAECWGTKEREICSCGGDARFCNFYHNGDKVSG